MSITVIDQCPICGHQAQDHTETTTEAGYAVARCRACALIAAEMRRRYGHGYWSGWGPFCPSQAVAMRHQTRPALLHLFYTSKR